MNQSLRTLYGKNATLMAKPHKRKKNSYTYLEMPSCEGLRDRGIQIVLGGREQGMKGILHWHHGFMELDDYG